MKDIELADYYDIHEPCDYRDKHGMKNSRMTIKKNIVDNTLKRPVFDIFFRKNKFNQNKERCYEISMPKKR